MKRIVGSGKKNTGLGRWILPVLQQRANNQKPKGSSGVTGTCSAAGDPLKIAQHAADVIQQLGRMFRTHEPMRKADETKEVVGGWTGVGQCAGLRGV